MNRPFSFTFANFHCVPVVARLPNGNILLELLDNKTLELVTTASIIVNEILSPRFIFVKNYSEHVGLPEALEAAGICAPTGTRQQFGFATVPLMQFTPQFLDYEQILDLWKQQETL